MKNYKLLETVADIAYIAGNQNAFSGNSRLDIETFISWALEFQKLHKETDWDQVDYILEIDSFAGKKLANAFENLAVSQ